MNYCINILLLLTCSCIPTAWEGWDSYNLTPRASATYEEFWTGQVRAEASVWNAALEAKGCEPPFTVGKGGHRVDLVVPQAWHNGNDTMGITFRWPEPEYIQIRALKDGSPPNNTALQHELGHTLGLDDNDDPGSLMYHNPKVFLQPKDVEEAATILGCSL